MTDKTQKVASKAANTAGETKVRIQRKPKPITLAKYKIEEVYRAAEKRVGRETDDNDMKLNTARALIILRDKVSELGQANQQPGPQQSEIDAENQLPSNNAQIDIVVEKMINFASAPDTNPIPDVSLAVSSYTAVEYAKRCFVQGKIAGPHEELIQLKTAELSTARKTQSNYRKANGYGGKQELPADVARTLVDLHIEVEKLELERAELVAEYRKDTAGFNLHALEAREGLLGDLLDG